MQNAQKGDTMQSVATRQMLAGIFASFATVIPHYVHAQWRYDAKQVQMLPTFCKYTQLYRDAVPGGNNPTEIERWSSAMGGDRNFSAMHHYCWGLEHTNRAMYIERTKQARDAHLTYSIGEFEYVIKNAKPDFVMLPEILTKKGENLIRLERAAEGIPDLLRAIQRKPDYWPPYVALSDYYKSAGDAATAREWAQKGLAAAPHVKPLQRRLAELDSAQGRRKPTPEK
jgi:tetratricopeptide (TPR) repeat protein